MATNQKIRILVVNPNTSQHMTDALKPVVSNLGYENVVYTYFTSPQPGIPSINSDTDAARSAEICLPSLIETLNDHDLFLIACYSRHPLVSQLQAEIARHTFKPAKYVTGIFEASVTVSLMLCGSSPDLGFGIVSTGKIWETVLQKAVDDFLGHDSNQRDSSGGGGSSSSTRFLGCETTGLNASELHEVPPDQVRVKMKEATKKLFTTAKRRNVSVGAICLGCAGMVGLEEAVREASVEEVGRDAGSKVAIVDGVKAGIGQLISLYRSGN